MQINLSELKTPHSINIKFPHHQPKQCQNRQGIVYHGTTHFLPPRRNIVNLVCQTGTYIIQRPPPLEPNLLNLYLCLFGRMNELGNLIKNYQT